ncbi:hypothetical protein L596_014816 [Steinernema carpocapsae]|uniref:BPTI/Kunitz inhibitor domain-containing protein n=1 Tax=Steinernema carpocapsae TaxID=34508 RepID=A0A4U5ND95_STECR|nr:hypothetical protein L596_014816 [Steinernema carpocapsae]
MTKRRWPLKPVFAPPRGDPSWVRADRLQVVVVKGSRSSPSLSQDLTRLSLHLLSLALFFSRNMTSLLKIWVMIICIHTVWSKLDCDPNSNSRKVDPNDVTSYLYCNLEGLYARRNCVDGKIFNSTTMECEIPPGVARHSTNLISDDPTLHIQFQAPDDLCGSGVALTHLSAPVVCNPSISSCPKSYVCTLYARTGNSYCCRNPGGSSSSDLMCANDQITFIDPLTGAPKTCAMNRADSCPVGFGCNVVQGSVTRCCGRDFGCPPNSAGYVQARSGSHLQCSLKSSSSCSQGFFCTRSSLFNSNICCSKTSSLTSSNECPGEELADPNPCSASYPCPAGYVCRNARCCPAKGLCPAGDPFGGLATSCGPDNPCPDNYQCVTRNGEKYCCPTPEHVCLMPWNAGQPCSSTRPSVRRFYFDGATGSCRSFQFSQCRGNANNFETLQQCEGFCLESQCSAGVGFRVASSIAHCSPSGPATCPSSHVCQPARFGTHHICCPTPEDICSAGTFTAGIPCFSELLTVQRFYFDANSNECKPFQFFGCGATNNNFASAQECNSVCIARYNEVCEGAAFLSDPSGVLQKCSLGSVCPSGYSCREGHCCPSRELACGSAKSAPEGCPGGKRMSWVFDAAINKCVPFFGCAGTPNRFVDSLSCERLCLADLDESCPDGMTPLIRSGGRTKSCTINLQFSCPNGHSCVRSPSSGNPICCKWKAQCPRGRRPYLIPGSDSQVACQLNVPSCPAESECLQSSTIANYGICCVRNAPSTYNSRKFCPGNQLSNGKKCIVNSVGDCPTGYVCLGKTPDSDGFCCKTELKCADNSTPYYFVPQQALVCDDEMSPCPSGSTCASSNVASTRICCKKHRARPSTSKGLKCRSGGNPFYEEGNSKPKQCLSHKADQCPRGFACQPGTNGLYYCCPASALASCPKGMIPNPLHTECHMDSANCPSGYTCEGTSVRSICCMNPVTSARCPVSTTPYLYLGRPLQCPAGSFSCPSSYQCIRSTVSQIHLCCTKTQQTNAQCLRGIAYEHPISGDKVFCSPTQGQCPLGFTCRESTVPSQFICCSADFKNQRFEGFCPVGQVPFIPHNSQNPPTCHMVLSPCPTDRIPYNCIYSAEKQNSYCCSPIESSARFASRQGIARFGSHIPPVRRILGVPQMPQIPTIPNVQVAQNAQCEPPSRPLVDGFGQSVLCASANICPPPFECRNGVCCSPLVASGIFPPLSSSQQSNFNRRPLRRRTESGPTDALATGRKSEISANDSSSLARKAVPPTFNAR